MRIHLWGTDFRRGTAQMRAKLYFAPHERASRLKDLLSLGFADLVYLYTCNRVEIYTTAPDHFCDTRPLWMQTLKHLGLTEEDYYKGYQLEGKSALRHLVRVACSLESLVVGEPQILGQLKEAFHFSKENGLPIDNQMDRAFQLAFETAKRVRSETDIGEKPVSVATLGLKHFQSMEATHPLKGAVIVGRSAIGQLVLQWFLKNRPQCPLLWVNRTLEALDVYPESQSVQGMKLSHFLETPPTFSHLFTATASTQPIFNEDFFSRLAPSRKLVFDFAQPPDVEKIQNPALDVTTIHLEDLREEAKENSEARALGVQQAEAIIEAHLKEFFLEQKEAPLLRDFNSVEQQFLEELTLALSTIQKDLPPELQQRLRKWAEKLVKKNLHNSREHLRFVLRKVSEPGQFSNI